MNRDFKGIWIPREIWLAKDLKAQEKALWAEIHSLYDEEHGGCYASNDYLCEFIGVKERRLQVMIGTLKEKGWLEQVSFNGRQRILKAIIPTDDPSCVRGRGAVNCGSEVHKNAPLGCSKMHPSPYIENKEENKDKNIARTTASPRQEDPDISFSFDEKKFTGIKEDDLAKWKEIYDGIDIVRELRRMVEWCLSNPKKAKIKKQWRKFITTWLQNEFERATNRAAIRGQKQKSIIDDHKVNEKYWGGKPSPGAGKRKVIDCSEDV